MTCPKRIGQYHIDKSLGFGGFGQVFLGHKKKSLQEYAIKLSSALESLQKEYKILTHLQKIPGIPKVFEYGLQETHGFIVEERLGSSLAYDCNDYLLSLECVCAIGVQLINILEQVHKCGILHKDLKPAQFLRSVDQKELFLVDFGLSSFFVLDGRHKGFKTRRTCKGSVSFASINNHLGFKQSRRDDIESLCYSLIYLVHGKLPWKSNSDFKGLMKWKHVLIQKFNIGEAILFKDLHVEFFNLYKYSRKLTYEQCPDYAYMKGLLGKIIDVSKTSNYFDWIQKYQPNKNLQIVEGATQITKLTRGKKIFVEPKKKKKLRGKKKNRNLQRKSMGAILSLDNAFYNSRLRNNSEHDVRSLELHEVNLSKMVNMTKNEISRRSLIFDEMMLKIKKEKRKKSKEKLLLELNSTFIKSAVDLSIGDLTTRALPEIKNREILRSKSKKNCSIY